MAALHCPRCKAAVVIDGKSPPHCVRCGKPLRCCRYCVFFEPRSLACEHPEILEPERVVDADAPRECPYFRLRLLAARRPGRLLGLSPSTWAAIAVLGMICSLLYMGMSRYAGGGVSREVDLQLQLQSAGTVIGDEPFDIIFSIYNPGRHRARHVTLLFAKESLQAAEVVSSDPPARGVRRSGNSLFLDYGELPAGGALLGRVTLRALRTGHFPLRVMLLAENARRPETAQTRLRIAP